MASSPITDQKLTDHIVDFLSANSRSPEGGYAPKAEFAAKLIGQAFHHEKIIRSRAEDRDEILLNFVRWEEAHRALMEAGHYPDGLMEAIEARIHPYHAKGYDRKRGIVHTNACYAAWVLRKCIPQTLDEESFALWDVQRGQGIRYFMNSRKPIGDIVNVAEIVEVHGDNVDLVKRVVYTRVLSHFIDRRIKLLKDFVSAYSKIEGVEWNDAARTEFWLTWLRPDVQAQINGELKEIGTSMRFKFTLQVTQLELSDEQRLTLLQMWKDAGGTMISAAELQARVLSRHGEEVHICQETHDIVQDPEPDFVDDGVELVDDMVLDLDEYEVDDGFEFVDDLLDDEEHMGMDRDDFMDANAPDR